MANNKVNTFIGFSIRANKVAFGMNAIELLKRGVHLIVVCKTLSQNSFKNAVKYSQKFSCPLVICNCGLEKVVYKTGCKMIAVKDKNLATAIIENIENADNDYKIYVGGNS